jgi:hypothetical protein
MMALEDLNVSSDYGEDDSDEDSWYFFLLRVKFILQNELITFFSIIFINFEVSYRRVGQI